MKEFRAAPDHPGIGQRLAPPRFISFLIAAAIGFAAASIQFDWSKAALMGFDVGAIVFLLSTIPLLDSSVAMMRTAAIRNDANRALLLVITGLVCTVVLVAIGVELDERTAPQPLAIALIIATLLLAWLFSNMVYALHYAHLFYTRGPKGGGDHGGIDFPGDRAEPDYWDFIYFAFTLGMTFQTSDVEISLPRIRRIVTIHCFAAFIFNIGVLAFTINVLGS
jgi:uncharacterized membrane protein